jgi:hypothetical protein
VAICLKLNPKKFSIRISTMPTELKANQKQLETIKGELAVAKSEQFQRLKPLLVVQNPPVLKRCSTWGNPKTALFATRVKKSQSAQADFAT